MRTRLRDRQPAFCAHPRCIRSDIKATGLCGAHYQAVSRKRGILRRPSHVDATPVRDHLAHLAANGIPPYRVAEHIGMTAVAVRAIANGNTRRVRRDTARRILAITGTGVDIDARRIDSWPTVQRLRSLARIGLTDARIADQASIAEPTVQRLIRGHRAVTTRHVAAQVAAAWDRLAMSPVPVVAPARARRWPTPWDLDDDLTPMICATCTTPMAPQTAGRIAGHAVCSGTTSTECSACIMRRNNNIRLGVAA